MEWPTRQKIAVGTAKGLEYLHQQCQPRIIHRDIKSANILLDSNWEAKVTPFLEVGNYDGLVDPRLMGRYNNDEMMRLIKCAAACVRHKPECRPKMNKVVLVLTGNASVDILRAGTAPAERSNRNMEQPLVTLNHSNSGSASSYVSISLREQEATEDSGSIQSTQPEPHRLASQRQQSQRRQNNIHGATV